MASSQIYSYRFVAESDFTGTAEFLVPTGYTAVVRCVDGVVTAPVDAATIMSFSIIPVAFLSSWQTLPTTTTVNVWRGRQVAREGELIRIQCNFAADFSVSGYLLSGVFPGT